MDLNVPTKICSLAKGKLTYCTKKRTALKIPKIDLRYGCLLIKNKLLHLVLYNKINYQLPEKCFHKKDSIRSTPLLHYKI